MDSTSVSCPEGWMLSLCFSWKKLPKKHFSIFHFCVKPLYAIFLSAIWTLRLCHVLRAGCLVCAFPGRNCRKNIFQFSISVLSLCMLFFYLRYGLYVCVMS